MALSLAFGPPALLASPTSLAEMFHKFKLYCSPKKGVFSIPCTAPSLCTSSLLPMARERKETEKTPYNEKGMFSEVIQGPLSILLKKVSCSFVSGCFERRASNCATFPLPSVGSYISFQRILAYLNSILMTVMGAM